MHLVAPVVTTTSIILRSSNVENGDILVLAYPGCPEKWPLNKCWNIYWLIPHATFFSAAVSTCVALVNN